MTTTKMITADIAMEKLNCSYPTLLRKVKAKSLPFVKLGNKLLFPVSWFDSLEEQAYSNYKRGQNEEVNCD